MSQDKSGRSPLSFKIRSPESSSRAKPPEPKARPPEAPAKAKLPEAFRAKPLALPKAKPAEPSPKAKPAEPSPRVRLPQASSGSGLAVRRAFLMTLGVSLIAVIVFVGIVAAVLMEHDGGALASLSSNAVETGSQSSLPRSEANSPVVHAAPTQAATLSPKAQRPAGGTATKTSAARKGVATATRPMNPTSVRPPTLTPASPGRQSAGAVAAATRAPTIAPTATHRPVTPYPTGGPPPPRPGTCILGCD